MVDTPQERGAVATAETGDFRLSAQQVAFFESFGFLKLPGLFAPELAAIDAAFDEVFADEANVRTEMTSALHLGEPRVILPSIVDKHETLRAVRHDPRILGIVESLIGPEHEYAESDGNLFYCDTSWHCDVYGSPLNQFHLRIAFYLEPLDERSGALRVIPGTNHWRDGFPTRLRKDLLEPENISHVYGVTPVEVPSWTIVSEPGDALVFAYRTLHASFNGGRVEPRRYFSMSFKEPAPASGR